MTRKLKTTLLAVTGSTILGWLGLWAFQITHQRSIAAPMGALPAPISPPLSERSAASPTEPTEPVSARSTRPLLAILDSKDLSVELLRSHLIDCLGKDLTMTLADLGEFHEYCRNTPHLKADANQIVADAFSSLPHSLFSKIWPVIEPQFAAPYVIAKARIFRRWMDEDAESASNWLLQLSAGESQNELLEWMVGDLVANKQFDEAKAYYNLVAPKISETRRGWLVDLFRERNPAFDAKLFALPQN